MNFRLIEHIENCVRTQRTISCQASKKSNIKTNPFQIRYQDFTRISNKMWTNFVQNFNSISQQMTNIFFRKMHSNQKMLDNRNECTQKNYFWCGNGALDGH